jgi:hypothetical protein
MHISRLLRHEQSEMNHRVVIEHLFPIEAVERKNQLVKDGLILNQDFVWEYSPATYDNDGYSAVTPRLATFKFVDASLKDYSLDINNLKKVITTRTKVLIVTSLYGIRPPAKELLALAKIYKFKIIEDASQSHGANLFSVLDKKSLHKSAWIGSTFSFYPTKNLGALGDGGAIITNSKLIKDKREGCNDTTHYRHTDAT